MMPQEKQSIHENSGNDIKQIIIQWKRISPNQMIHFSQNNWSYLDNIDLFGNKVADMGCKYLSRASLPNLKYLNLCYNQIGSNGVMHFSKAQWSLLQKIYLSDNKIGVSSTGWLIKVNWQKVQIISLFNNKLTIEEILYLLMGELKQATYIWLCIQTNNQTHFLLRPISLKMLKECLKRNLLKQKYNLNDHRLKLLIILLEFYLINRYKNIVEAVNMFTRLLKENEIQSGVQLILNEFQPDQPLTKTFALNYPDKQLTLDQRTELWAHWIKFSIHEGLIVGAFTNQNTLIGLSICKDINYELPQIQEDYSNGLTEEKCFIELQQKFVEQMNQQLRQKIQIEGTALEIMIIVVKKTYQGNGLSKLLILESETIAKSKGFTYCYCQASNFKTGKSLAKNCFTKLFEVDLKEFQVEGVKPFFNIDEQNRIASSWLKTLQL